VVRKFKTHPPLLLKPPEAPLSAPTPLFDPSRSEPFNPQASARFSGDLVLPAEDDVVLVLIYERPLAVRIDLRTHLPRATSAASKRYSPPSLSSVRRYR
jgi:hypothetical protein